MSAPGIDPRVLDALQNASSLELFQLSTLIERLLADPRRIIAVRKDMHLGQTVRFVDWRDGSLRQGKVVAMRETQVTLQDLQERKEWKLPYAAIEPPHPDPAAPPQALGRVNTNSDSIHCGGYSGAWRSHPSNSPRLNIVCPSSVATSA